MKEKDHKFNKLVETVQRLRQPDGCPWDQKQTVESFRPYLIEELHELLEALDLNDHQHVKEELGDLLFQIVFLNNLYEEQGCFNMSEVIETITDKMIRRHPHVFGNKKFASEKERRRNWNQIKSKEGKGGNDQTKGLFTFPRSLPALLRAQRVSERAVSSGFEWPDLDAVFHKLEEETIELKEAVSTGDQQHIEEEIGDMLFCMVNIARKAGFDAEQTLQKSSDKFIRRFSRMAELAEEQGSFLEKLNIEEMQLLWGLVKKEEQSPL
jgi:tetrapyrrole methylase family protein/MazG family protein